MIGILRQLKFTSIETEISCSGTFRAKTSSSRDGSRKKKFERDVSSQDDSRIFPKIDFKVLFIKIYYQLNAMDM